MSRTGLFPTFPAHQILVVKSFRIFLTETRFYYLCDTPCEYPHPRDVDVQGIRNQEHMKWISTEHYSLPTSILLCI